MIDRTSELKRLAKLGITLAICLSLLVNAPSMSAQAATQGTTQAPGQSSSLIITILDGEGALNDIHQRTAREPIVQVEDENHKPIAGAVVLFSLPGSGPGGTFAGGVSSFSTVTDNTGRAIAQGLQPNKIAGSYNIHVRVNYNGATSETDIDQKNENRQQSKEHNNHGFPTKVVVSIAAIAAAGAIVGILATRGNSPTTITAGNPGVNPPTAVPGIRIPLRLHSR